MSHIALGFIYLVCALHVWFFVLQSILWTKPIGRKLMKISESQAETSRTLALNQGCYNLILGIGLWNASHDFADGWLKFFLMMIVILGVIGAVSTKKPIIFILQALPAIFPLGYILYMN